jgi:hypothetical protein
MSYDDWKADTANRDGSSCHSDERPRVRLALWHVCGRCGAGGWHEGTCLKCLRAIAAERG